MKKLYLWLSGVFTVCFVVHLTRLLLKLRIDVNLHRIPLKISAVMALVGLVLAVGFYLLSKENKPKA